MKNKAIIIIITLLLASLFVSCRSKRITSVETKIDTVYNSKVVTITPSSLKTLKIDNPCDSLGQLKPFFYTLNSGNDKLTVKTIDNTILVEQNLDSIKQVWEKEYKSSVKEDVSITEVEVTPKWAYKTIIGLIISIFLNIVLIYFLTRKFLPKLNIFK